MGLLGRATIIVLWIYPPEPTLPEARYALRMELTAQAVIDSRDLLDGVSPLLKGLIYRLISKPSYHGILADATVWVAGEKIEGQALYESMYFRRKKRDNRV